MAMKDVVMKNLIQAMKDKNVREKGVLQLLKSGLENAEKVKKAQLTEKEEFEVVQREIKQNKDFLVETEKLNRTDSIEDTKEKIEILYAYLPEQLTADEVKATLVKLGIQKAMKKGEAMIIAIPSLEGRTEKALISQIVDQLIK